jgi:hypothetical protein
LRSWRDAGRGIAVALGEAGATIYCAGRTTRSVPRSTTGPETIEETAELVDDPEPGPTPERDVVGEGNEHQPGLTR